MQMVENIQLTLVLGWDSIANGGPALVNNLRVSACWVIYLYIHV